MKKPKPRPSGGFVSQDRSGTGLAIVRIFIGVFFLFQGLGKLAWFTDSGILFKQLNEWVASATPAARWYLQTVCIPGAAVFARLVPLGELSAGVALVLGVWTRLAAALASLMVISFLVASSSVFSYSFLTFGYGLPVLGSLLGLAIGGARLRWSLRRG